MITGLSPWQSNCEGTLDAHAKCRLYTKWPPTLRPSQLTWAATIYNPLSAFIIITQPEG